MALLSHFPALASNSDCVDDRELTECCGPERLSKTLRQCGALRDGRVREVVVESSRATLLSRIIRLRLVYEGDARDAPLSVIFKTGLPERLSDSWTGGRQEVAFYTQVAAVMSKCLVPRCFEAHWDLDTNAWHLLLEDLTDTHVVATTWPLPPTTEQCEQILRALARPPCRVVGSPPSRRLRWGVARRRRHRPAPAKVHRQIQELCRSAR